MPGFRAFIGQLRLWHENVSVGFSMRENAEEAMSENFDDQESTYTGQNRIKKRAGLRLIIPLLTALFILLLCLNILRPLKITVAKPTEPS